MLYLCLSSHLSSSSSSSFSFSSSFPFHLFSSSFSPAFDHLIKTHFRYFPLFSLQGLIFYTCFVQRLVNCCLFQRANRCFACRLLVKIVTEILKDSFCFFCLRSSISTYKIRESNALYNKRHSAFIAAISIHSCNQHSQLHACVEQKQHMHINLVKYY